MNQRTHNPAESLPSSLTTEQIRLINANLQRNNPSLRGFGVSRHDLVNMIDGMSASQRDAFAQQLTGSRSISWGSLMNLHETAAQLLHPTAETMTELGKMRMTPEAAVKFISRQMGITSGEYIDQLIDSGGARDAQLFVAEKMAKPEAPEPEGAKALRQRHAAEVEFNSSRRAALEAAFAESADSLDAPGRDLWQREMSGRPTHPNQPGQGRSQSAEPPSLRSQLKQAFAQAERKDEFGFAHLRDVRELDLAENGGEYLAAAAYGTGKEADYSDLASVDQHHKLDGSLGEWNSSPPAPPESSASEAPPPASDAGFVGE